MDNVLIVGANGKTGTRISKLLKASDKFEPLAMIRDKEQESKFKDLGVATRLGNLEKEHIGLVQDVDRIIFAAGAGGESSKEKTIIIDQESAKRLIDVAKLKGVKKFVMLSSIGAGHPEDSDELQDYLKAKQAADEHLMDSGLEYTIVRPGTLNDNEGQGKIEWKKQFDKPGEISRDDVAQVLVDVLPTQIASGKTFEIIEGSTVIDQALKSIS